MAGPPDIPTDGLPLYQQILFGLGLFGGGVVLAFREWVKGRSKEPEKERQVVLDRASIADIRPLTEMGVDIRAMLEEQRKQTTDIRAIRELLEEENEEREDYSKMRQAIRDEMEEERAARKPPRTPPRRRKP